MICAISTLSCGGITNIPRKNSELVDAVFTSSKALYYTEGCENDANCGASRVERHVDRVLVCENLHPSIAELYNRPYKIEAGSSFIVKSVVDIGCWGLVCTFGGGDHAIVLLEDSNGLLSTKELSSMDTQRRDVCE